MPWLLLIACASEVEVASTVPLDAPMDGLPGLVTPGPGGGVAEVRTGGDLVVDGAPVDREVMAELAWRPDGGALVYSKRNGTTDADLYEIEVPVRASELGVVEKRLLTGWVGSEDRPAYSPDGAAIAFVSGRTGIASVWVLDPEPRQVTNVGLERVARAPGEPPPGFVPPPEGPLSWTAEGLVWTAEGRRIVVSP